MLDSQPSAPPGAAPGEKEFISYLLHELGLDRRTLPDQPLTLVCATMGYPLTVVTDPNTSRHSTRVMESLGADVVEVNARDANGGYLHTRLNYIRQRLGREPELVWLNQHANPANVRAHRDRTARSIHRGLEVLS